MRILIWKIIIKILGEPPRKEPEEPVRLIQKHPVSPVIKRKEKGKCAVTDKVQRDEKTAKRNAKRRKLRAYKCEYCSHWHYTHKKDKITMH